MDVVLDVVPDAEPGRDASPDTTDDTPGADTRDSGADGCEAMDALQARCALSACHLPGNRRTELVLTRAALEAGAVDAYVVAGDPDGSYLYQRMVSSDAGPLMPLGAAHPIPEAALVRAWIEGGAPTSCASPAAPTPTDPNLLDVEALFSCSEAAGVVTPARLRRVERREWTHAVLKPLSGTWWGSTAKDNPLEAPGGLPYSTYAQDVTVDEATLDLYLLVLPEAPASWNAQYPNGGDGFISGTRTAAIVQDRELRCMWRDTSPDDACIDYYVSKLLTTGVLFREPTPGEFQRARAFLVSALSEEAGPDERRATLQHVGEACFLMAGALFRSELGESVDDGPRRLTAGEMSVAVGRALSSHPVGAPIPQGVPESDPDAAMQAQGRLARVRAAGMDGSIFEDAVIDVIIETYGGGVDAGRHDLWTEVDDRRIPSRGEYYLAENMMQFFREWLDYDGAVTAFKDTPGATSHYHDDTRPTTLGFSNLQSRYYGHESSLAAQLDDAIARVVVESHRDGTDVFRALLTTRMWRLPSTVRQLSGIPCDSEADCSDPYRVCTPHGECGTPVAGAGPSTQARVYHVDRVGDGEGERWVEMDARERSGVLTHPAWLAAHGGNFEDDASAVLRGHWIRERLLCETVPGLELVSVEAQLVPSAPDLSARARLVASVEDPASNPHAATCMGCHSQMNPLGYPFETFNHAGFLREFDRGSDGSEVAPDGSSDIVSVPDPALEGSVDGPVEFSERLADSRVARRCFIRQVFRYFMGRDEQPADACTLSEMEASLDRDGSFPRMVGVLMKSDTFQRRLGPEDER